ncbi:multiple C2 and transmembrane domain-containing protein [Rhagoletis pomonella]|uniref:multiple C2 and transmembrane domain-containing protein n=1 Tax=Rhagoletis pomonella TaxID=28610 RepID=UPI00177D63D3|nr:multiple C2 and transmembrane domain-containing protein [Rhagoletis pomonella]
MSSPEHFVTPTSSTARIHYSDDFPSGSVGGGGPYAQHYTKNGGQASQGATPHGSPQLTQRLGRHLSKSASELNGHDCHDERDSPRTSPKRAKSAATAHSGGGGSGSGASGVFHKTHGFFNTLKHRWSRAKSKDRAGRKSPSDFLEESTDYAADYSSESSSVTQSPRHRATTIGGSPLTKEFSASARMAQMIHRFGGSMEGRIEEQPENGSGNGSTGGGGGVGVGSASMEEYVTPKHIESLQLLHLQHFQRNTKLAESSKRLKSQIWSSVVTILLVKAKDLPLADDGSKLTDIHIKFRLGNEKYKSKSSWTERWLEQFDLHLFDEDQNLELSLWNRNALYGKANIDLSVFQRETTHGIWRAFEDCSGEVLLMLTISGTTALETITDLKAYKEDPREVKIMRDRYRWHRCFQNLRDVGHLTVKVFGATGLAAADIGGKSDPFCVLELGNARLQTQTEYKTLTPTWNKIFTFNVKDITQVLEITVYDEDRDHRVEFLGKLVIPLLRIKNGVKRWYTLKDKNLCVRAKGLSPQICLEMIVIWNDVRAICRILQPKEEKLIQQEAKFKRQLFLRNVNRLKVIIMNILDAARYVQSCFEWESPLRSAIAFALWILACVYGDLATVPLVLLLIIIKNWLVRMITGTSSDPAAGYYDYDYDEDDDDDKEKEEKKSIKERLQTVQEVSQTVQNTIGYLATLGESTKNTFNFSVPELTWLAAVLLIGAIVVLHFIPIRFLLLFWGIMKFSRRILRPNTIPNNELLDFLSRVPDDELINQFRELPPTAPTDQSRNNPKKKYKPS